MNMYFKKQIATVFVLLSVVVSIFAIPERAHAQYAVFDAAAVGQLILKKADDAQKWIRENWERVMRDVIAKRIIDYTVDETVKWVQGGGDPKFISDWNGFMKEAGEMAFDSVIKDAELSDICEPFALQLRVALIPETRFNRERVDCSISDIVANVQDFYDNFQNGGWLAYGESIKPQNNLYMQLVMFDDEINLRTAFNEDQRRQQAAAGQGFLSVSTCVENDAQELYESCIDGNGGTPDECAAYAEQAKQCTKEEVQTPGTIVGKALGESMTSDQVWAANIQSWTSALVNAAINRLTREGVAAMTGSSSGASASYDPSYSEYGSLRDAELNEDKRNFIEQVETITVPYRQLLTEKQTAKTYTEQILDLFAQMNLIDVNRVCVPQTTPAEVAAQQTILSTLTTRINGPQIAPNQLIVKVNGLQPIVAEGDAIIAQVRTMTGSTRDMSINAAAVSNYLDKRSFAEQQAVRDELAVTTDRSTQYATLQDVQSRFNQCRSRIELTTAPSS